MTDQPRKRITIDASSGSTILAARHLDANEGRVQIGATVDTATRSAITHVLSYVAKAHNSPAAPLPSIHANDVQGFCPACGHGVLMLGDGGHIVCTLIDCPDPDAVDKLLTRTDTAATTCNQPGPWGDAHACVLAAGHPDDHQGHDGCGWRTGLCGTGQHGPHPGFTCAEVDASQPYFRVRWDQEQQRPATNAPASVACRRMETRTCPASYAGPCGERPCARFESDDPAPWLGPVAEAVRQMDADPTQPHTGLVIQPYYEHGVEKWVFRCWGTDTCDGLVSLDHTSQQGAKAARDRHLAEEHCECGGTIPHPDCPVHPPTTEPTKEQPMPTDEPDCTATIDGPHIPGDSPVACTRKAHGNDGHVGPEGADGKVLWNDHHAGAVPHGASSEEQH